jgi:hypothetical protein
MYAYKYFNKKPYFCKKKLTFKKTMELEKQNIPTGDKKEDKIEND